MTIDDNELPEGSIEVVLDEDPRAPAPPPSSGVDSDAPPAERDGSGNRTGYDQRISQLVARRSDAERSRDAERERADRLEAELAATKSHLASLDQRQQATDQHLQGDLAARERAVKQYELDGKIQRLTAEKATAHENGESGKVASLDVEIAEALWDRRELGREAAASSRPSAPQQTQQQPTVDANMQAFQTRNADWWQRDPAKTATAWEVHAQIKAKNPTAVGTSDYYRTIEAEVARRHPASGQPGSEVPPLNNGGNTSQQITNLGNGKQRIILSKDDVEHARKMGLTPAQWADGIRMANSRGEMNLPARGS